MKSPNIKNIISILVSLEFRCQYTKFIDSGAETRMKNTNIYEMSLKLFQRLYKSFQIDKQFFKKKKGFEFRSPQNAYFQSKYKVVFVYSLL